jgi:hypothetical protein
MSGHEKIIADPNQPYESNEIQLRGIIGFGVGLFALIVLTFFAMWFLLYRVLETGAEKEDAAAQRPMMMSSKEQLPPEPRLQAAPGFGVDRDKARINLELTPPQSEFIELRKIWEEKLSMGETDPATGTVITLPIEEAKQKLLEAPPKSLAGPEAQKEFDDSRMSFSGSSAGRVASEKRR